MVSVLGKRTRSSTVTTPDAIRSKRLTRSIDVHNDENDNPFITDPPSTISKHAAQGLANFHVSTPSQTRKVGRPAKHGQLNGRASVTGIEAHFKVAKSPDTVDLKLEKTKQPLTPRHRDSLPAKVLVTPQSCARVRPTLEASEGSETPSADAKTSIYAQARQLFSGGSDAALLVGRADERKQVSDFIESHIESRTGGCLYVSGPPGTGKSAFVSNIISTPLISNNTRPTMINCMSIRSTNELVQTLATELGVGATSKMDVEALKSHLLTSSTGNVVLIVLDEIDRLIDLDLNLLYSLFEWSMAPTSRFLLIGIANALDLTDRLLPRLKARSIRPALLPFMPYTSPQICDIITTKLRSLSTNTSDALVVPLLHPAAIQLCSKKVSSQTGDLRKAFDIVKRALSLAETEARASTNATQSSPSKPPLKTPLSENVNLSSPPVASPSASRLPASLSHLTAETAPRATIAHVAKVTSQIFSNGTSSRISRLSIQQKAVLCALAASEKRARSALSNALSSMASFVPATPSKSGRGKNGSPTTKQLYDSYAELCKRDNLLHPLGSVEFKDVLSGLETLSLIEFVDGKGKGSLGLMTPTRTPSRKGKKNDFGQMNLGSMGAGDERRLSSVVGFVELRDSLTGPGSEILKEILEG